MTKPVHRLPGSIYFITATCERHEYRLSVDQKSVGVLTSILKTTSEKYGIQVMAFCQMSSHYHSLVYDPRGLVSLFLREFHAGFAKYGNKRDKTIGERFWAMSGPEVIRVHESDSTALVNIMGYIMGNPVKDAVVHSPELWKGLCTKADEIGGLSKQRFKLDENTIGNRSSWELEGTLSYSVPDCVITHISLESLRKQVKKRVDAYIKIAKNRMPKGRIEEIEAEEQGILPSSFSSFKDSAKGSEKRKDKRKRVAASNPETLRLLIAELMSFHEYYLAALKKADLDEDAIFPAGTWWRYYKLGYRRYTPENKVERYHEMAVA